MHAEWNSTAMVAETNVHLMCVASQLDSVNSSFVSGHATCRMTRIARWVDNTVKAFKLFLMG